MKKVGLLIALPILVLLIIILNLSFSSDAPENNATKVTVYKSPTCGCCVNYVALLEMEGYEVETIETDNMSNIKQQYGIASEMESCHTAVFGDYVVEGHVPLELVAKLLKEKPDIRGIALPDMPAGSPGMPGQKRGPFQVYALSDSGSYIYTEY